MERVGSEKRELLVEFFADFWREFMKSFTKTFRGANVQHMPYRKSFDEVTLRVRPARMSASDASMSSRNLG